MPTIAEELIQRGREEGEKRGREEGKRRGREEGKKKAKLEIARRLLARGFPPDEVASLVDLPKEQVQALTH